MYILDTNTLIYFFKGMGKVGDIMLKKPPKDIAVPAIVIYELEYGIQKSASPYKRRNQLSKLCSVIEILPFTEKEAATAARIRVDLEKKGHPIGSHDILIAATALACNGTLISNNTGEFKRVPKLKLENWF